MPIRIGTLIAAVLALAGTLAAIAAHVVIDVVGDFALTRDAYDGVAHESRGLLLGLAAVVLGAIALRVLWDALVRRSGSLLAVSRRLRSGSFWQTAALVSLVAFVMLVGMEMLDSRLAGLPIDGLGDLLGGSILLGTAAAIACGTLAALACRMLLAAIAAWEPRLCAWLISLWSRGTGGAAGAIRPRRRERPVLRALPIMADRRGTRAPPLPFPNTP